MMANNHINELIATDELFQLIQKENFVGWVFSLDYDNALVVTNDAWKYAVKGIPHNAFLLASTFTPDNYADVDELEKQLTISKFFCELWALVNYPRMTMQLKQNLIAIKT